MLLAAADHLSRRPHATLAETAGAMGISRATLHRHFAGRGELLDALTDRATKRLHAAVTGARLTDGCCADALRRLVRCLEKDAPYLALLYSLSQEHTPDAPPAAWHESDTAIRRLFERGRESGEFTVSLTAAWLTEAFYGLIAAAVWATRSGRCARRDFVDMVTRTTLSGAAADAADA